MTVDEVGGPGSPGPSAELAKSRGRGADLFTVRIYQAVLDAGDQGLKAGEIRDRLQDIPGIVSDTERWRLEGHADIVRGHNISIVLLQRVRVRLHTLRMQGIVVTDNIPGRHDPSYIAGRPPKGYRPKYVRQSPHGWYDIDPAGDEAATRRHIDTVNWLNEARAQLTKRNPRRLRELVEQAITLLEHGER